MLVNTLMLTNEPYYKVLSLFFYVSQVIILLTLYNKVSKLLYNNTSIHHLLMLHNELLYLLLTNINKDQVINVLLMVCSC